MWYVYNSRRADLARYTQVGSRLSKKCDCASAEKVYRDALRIYPNNASMILGLSGVLALADKSKKPLN